MAACEEWMHPSPRFLKLHIWGLIGDTNSSPSFTKLFSFLTVYFLSFKIKSGIKFENYKKRNFSVLGHK